MINVKYFYLLLFFLIFSCNSSNTEKQSINSNENIRTTAKAFFNKYAERNDWEGFLDLYTKDLKFRDVLLQAEYDYDGFKNFYNWPDTAFRKHPDYPKSLVLEELLVNDSSAAGSGYFTPFYYQGILYKPEKYKMEFTMRLTFDKNLKIKSHIDWIKYPPEILKNVTEGQLKK